MPHDHPADIAKQLIAAERERVAIAPFTDANPELDIATAYLAQRAFVQAKLDAGEQVIGAKLGLTSKVKQQAMGVDAPLSGVVTSGMLSPFGVPIELSEFIHPRVEPEIAFVLARDVAAPATVSSVLAATESVYGAIDVLDSRYEDFRFALPDVIADNASAARFLVGPRSVARAISKICACSGVYSVRTVMSSRRRPGRRSWGIRRPQSPGWQTSWPSGARC